MKLFLELLIMTNNNIKPNGFKVGDVVEAQVTKIHNFGAVVKIGNNFRGLIHISQISDDFVKNINDYLKVGDKVKARIKKISTDGKIDLTLKTKKKNLVPAVKEKEFKFASLEEKMDAFLEKNNQDLK
ncbi:MAG: S1 RNA-binding domain-containing protein [Candidatus Omnitrophota bacterium]